MMNYEPTSHDIKIVINIKGNRRNLNSNNSEGRIVEPKLLIQVFDSIENALYESDRNDVVDFFRRYKGELNISNLTRDAAIHRIREYKHNRLLINEARDGSIEFEAFVIAVAALTLSSTLKESFKEGYKNSILHKRLSEYVRETIDNKTLYIAEKLRRAFGKKKRRVQVNVEQLSDNRPKQIEITVYEELILKELEKPELTLGEIVDKERL